jgi:hypothetical protein
MKKIMLFMLLCATRSEAQNIRVLEFSKGGNEPAITIDPEDNSRVIVAFNNFNVFKSSDTGKTFNRVSVKSKYGFYGDPVLYWGFGNDAYLAHLAKNRKYEWPLSFDRIVFQKIKFRKKKVRKSTGIGFSLTIFPKTAPYSRPNEHYSSLPQHKMQDKPWFTVNRNSGDPHFGRIHMAWTEFDSYGSKFPQDSSRIRYAWSDNRGKTFSSPITLSHVPGDAKDRDSTLEGATLCVDRAGNTYCLWSGLDQLWFTSSRNGGLNWNTPSVIGQHESGWHMEMGGIMRANGMPFIVALNKHLLIVWAAKQSGGSRIFYRFYNIEAGTWSMIGKMSVPGNENAFMPQICVKDGKAFIAFYSSFQTEKKNHFEIKVYTAMLDESNINFSVAARLLEGSPFISEGNPFLGDYIGICPLNQSSSDEAMVVYTTLIGNKDTYISLARVKF